MVSNTINSVFNYKSLLLNKSIYHDITRETIAPEHNITTILPEEAAHHLLNVSKNVDFTLFEYFMTDVAGHSQKEDILKKILNTLSSFVVTIKADLPDNTLLMITSDHGNCENLSVPGHTVNPVPLICYTKTSSLFEKLFPFLGAARIYKQLKIKISSVYCPKKTVLSKAKSIIDVYNLIIKILD